MFKLIQKRFFTGRSRSTVLAIFALILVFLGLLVWELSFNRGRIKIPEKVLIEDFQRPLDRELVEQLSVLTQTSIAQLLETNVIKPFWDDITSAQVNSEGVELRPGQFKERPDLCRIADDCARVLGVPKPRVFIVGNSAVISKTINYSQPIIVLNARLLKPGVNQTELRFIIGREMGHVACGHEKWQMVLHSILKALENAKLVPDSVKLAPFLPFFRWAREAEMSADNAGLICCQNLPIAEQALLRLVHGASELDVGKANVDLYLEQSATLELSTFSDVVIYWRELIRDHSFIPSRIRQLREYEKTRQFRHLWE